MRELRRPIGFCNPYFDSFSPLNDIAEAATLVDGFDLAPLHIRGAARLRWPSRAASPTT